MSDVSEERLASAKRIFLQPRNATHRQYEALRAYFVEECSAAEVAERFGYTPGTVRVMAAQLRKNPDRPFFLPTVKGPQADVKRDPVRERIIALRKQNFSVPDIQRLLAEEGVERSVGGIWTLLHEEGFARLPRRRTADRPQILRPEAAAAADVRLLDLSPRRVQTKFAGLYLFLPFLARIPFDTIHEELGLPGTKMVPAPHAVRSLLALKLWGKARHSRVMSEVLDEGLALFSGLNVIPKRALLTQYSSRIDPASYGPWLRRWHEALGAIGLAGGSSFDLDFHTIPFHGEDALVEKHYVSKRSRRQKGILAFLARDADTRVFCYVDAQCRKDTQADTILQFARFWHERTGHYPQELIFDSKLTTYTNLSWLNEKGISFITLRRRSKKMLGEIQETPASAWRRITLPGLSRSYRTPRVLDQRITLSHYDGPIRELVVADLGHEEPTLILTNQLSRSPARLVTRYAERMVIENAIADAIDFFHMDALSSTVPMKVTCDLQLTLMASTLYRLLGTTVGHGYETAKARHIFDDLVDASGSLHLTQDAIEVRLHKRARNPYLINAGFATMDEPIPWLGNKRLRFVFG